MGKTIKMPSSSEIAEAYREGAGRAPAKYKAKVAKTTGVIQAGIDGESLYAAKMQDVIANGTRAKGLSKVSDSDWQKGASEKGAARIGPGMLAAQDKRTRNYETTRSALDGLTLADKTTDAMTNIDNNVKAVVKAMQDAKKSRLGL